MELTQQQIERQDFVDNAILDLINEVNPSKTPIEWDVEKMGKIRDVVSHFFVENNICTDQEFYPEIEC